MIDWLTFTFKIAGDWRVAGDIITRCDSDTGEVKYEVSTYRFASRYEEGSASIKTGVRSFDYDADRDCTTIQVSGCPAKFYQGHNLWGSDDVRGILWNYGRDALGRSIGVSILPSTPTWGFKISAIDCTRNYQLPSREEVRAWLFAAYHHIHGGHQNVSRYDDLTIYVGQRSRRITTKLYCKGAEFDKRLEAGRRAELSIPKAVGRSDLYSEVHDLLSTYANGILRVEVRLRTLELKTRGWDVADAWTPRRVNAVINERLDKLGLEELTMNREVSYMDRLQQKIYGLWHAGVDLRSLGPGGTETPRATLYRYRKMMRKVGVNIDAPPSANVVPCLTYIADEGIAKVPEWGRGVPMMHYYSLPEMAGLAGVDGPACHWPQHLDKAA